MSTIQRSGCTARDSVIEDTASWKNRSMDEKDETLRSLLRFTDEMVNQSPKRERIRAWQDPRSGESERTWRDLIRRSKTTLTSNG